MTLTVRRVVPTLAVTLTKTFAPRRALVTLSLLLVALWILLPPAYHLNL